MPRSANDPFVGGSGVTTDNTQRVVLATDSPSGGLPAGAATAANQTSGAQKTQIVDSALVNQGTAGNPLRTDTTGTTTQPVSAASLPLPTGASTSAKQPALGTAGTPSADVITVQGVASMTPVANNQTQINGVTVSAGNGVAGTGVQRVTIASDNTAFTVNPSQATASSLNAQVVGNVAAGVADSGNPVKIGGVGRTTNPTAVADGQRVDLMVTKSGRLITVLGGPRELKVRNAITLTTTTETTLVAAGAAGVFHDIEYILVSNTSSTGVRVDFRDATAGTVQFSIYVAGSANGGISTGHPMFQNTAANNWTAQLSAAVTDVRIVAQAHKLT